LFFLDFFEVWRIAQKMISGLYDSSKIVEKIKSVAKKSGFTMAETWLRAGVNGNKTADLKKSMPKVDTVAKIADALDCSVDYLLGRTDNPLERSGAVVSDPLYSTLYNVMGGLDDVAKAKVLEYAELLRNSQH
jgi:lambda repressor-like predicted transcriptional regulator